MKKNDVFKKYDISKKKIVFGIFGYFFDPPPPHTHTQPLLFPRKRSIYKFTHPLHTIWITELRGVK